MKPDLRATTFSPLNAYFFAVLSKISYKTPSEAEGLLVGSSTSKGLGFDRFHWFEVSKTMPTFASLLVLVLYRPGTVLQRRQRFSPCFGVERQ